MFRRGYLYLRNEEVAYVHLDMAKDGKHFNIYPPKRSPQGVDDSVYHCFFEQDHSSLLTHPCVRV